MGRKIKNYIGIIIIAVISIALLIVNGVKNENFLMANITQILSLLVTAILSVYFVQRLTDKRRKTDCYERILGEIKTAIHDDKAFFSTDREALMLQTSIANKVKHLQEYAFPQIKDDLKYIENEYTELRELYGNHKDSVESLLKIRLDIVRHQSNIDDKIDKIQLMLYEL